MEYKSKSDLPATMRDLMPEEAQDIYLQAFKEAWETYHLVFAQTDAVSTRFGYLMQIETISTLALNVN